MALTIKQLNSSASFLLTFEPLGGTIREPFRILLDPVLSQPPADSLHSDSTSTLNGQPHISSLKDLPELDLIVISQSRSGHLHEATLKQLAPGGMKTLILAEPAAAKAIRGWKYFDHDVVRTLAPWEDPRQKGRDAVARLVVQPCRVGGDKGEVTVSLLPQKKDTKGTHSAVGITYRPPPSRPSIFRRPIPSPPMTPLSTVSATPPQLPPPITDTATSTTAFTARIVPPTPPDSPILSQPARTPQAMAASLPPHISDRTLSVIFSPHGTSYASLEPYATSHLVREAALPLTALLHSFNGEAIPWWWSVSHASAASPIGQETALALSVRAWIGISCDDQAAPGGGGGGKRSPRRKTYALHEVRDMLDQAERKDKKAPPSRGKLSKPAQILDLSQGDEAVLTSEGIWEETQYEALPQKNIIPDALGVFNNFPIFE